MTATRPALLFLASLLSAGAFPAWAQNYPTRPIRLIVALAAGTSSDTVARIIAVRLAEELHQQVVIDNRPGAGGSVGGEVAARAPADGYTLFFAANGTIAIAPNILKLSYDVSKDLAPISMVGVSPFVLMTHPSVPARSVKELIALARARPGKINFGSSGQGSTSHLAWELLKIDAKVNVTHVPYRGAAALINLLGGEIETVIFGAAAGLPYIERRQLRALGVTSAKRLPLLPDVPTIAETVPGYEVASWYAMLSTVGTPAPVIARLHEATVAAMASADVKDRLHAAGVDPTATTPQQLATQIREETIKWGKVVKAAGVKAE